jgi:hypothetical protein
VRLVRARRLPICLLAAALLGGCDLGVPGDRFPLRPPPAGRLRPQALVVGLVGTLSGPDSWRGEDAFEGADLGVHVLNRERPGDARPFELRPLDDGGDPLEAAGLVEELAALESTVGIVYAGPPEGLARATEALESAGIPGILCYGDPLGAAASSGHVFQVSPPLAGQARRLVSYILGDRGYAKVGVIAERSPTGAAAVAALRASLDGAARREAVVHYAPGRRDLRPLLARLRRARVEVVVVQGSPAATTAALAGLRGLGAAYRSTAAARIASAPRAARSRRLRSGWWHPQVVGFDTAVSARTRGARPGTAGADTYVRGAHYLPLAPLRSFRRAFRDWWGMRPLGWQQRAYDAALMIGWAAGRGARRGDLAATLEGLRGGRFSGLPVTFGKEDHVAPGDSAVGLWVVPRPGIEVRERRTEPAFVSFPWVPLARTFTTAGGRTTLPASDWPALFGRSRYASRPPHYAGMLWGVRTPPSDPVH